MSNIHELRSKRNVDDEASLWIARMDKGLSPDQEDQFRRWLSEAPEHGRIFVEFANDWDEMDDLARLSDLFPESQVGEKPNRRLTWAVAASLLLGFMFTTLMFTLDDGAGSPDRLSAQNTTSTTFQTLVGEQESIELSDGTRIVLNTNSELSVRYTSSSRLLSLGRGEIHVEVAHDPSRPLSVAVNGKIVQAVGTEFNLEITEHQHIELVVTEGAVIVGIADDPELELPENTAVVLEDYTTLVTAGQGLVIQAGEDLKRVEKEEIKAEEIAIKLSWREGNLIFRGEMLEEAVAEVSRYTAVEFVFLDEASKRVKVAGLFKAGDVDGLLATLRRNFRIAYEWRDDHTILLSSEQNQ